VLVTQAEFARLTGVSRSAIKQAIDNKLITALSVQNGKTFIEKTEGLQQYAKNSRRQKASQKSKPLQSPEPTGLGLLSWGQSPASSAAEQPLTEPSTCEPPPEPTKTPDYNEERAWHERERRLIAELDRRQKAGELVYKADVEQAQMAIALTLKNQLEALPKQVKQQLPHLSISDEEMIERLVAKVLTAVADWRMDQEEEE
jgi:hypothetical protein